ncbi:hypothetical protein H632_c4872p1 [Helicosporidium sp. ATCC 50920]|nr:hypothetical protein H632_c4872p1 [Helicosporidium sp. ATCC 50920]|eukprot:KDD71519.1 hypothetical protein H632_c4872p1 [Helicosporidium sp. ATCC 50920]
MVAGSHAMLDDVLGTAQGVAGSLSSQRQLFDGISGKVSQVGQRFPVVNTLLNAIRRRKNRDNVILGAVIAACTLFILVYWMSK